MNPNIQKARNNETQVLLTVGFVGWLTTAQVAAWVWPENDKHSATNRAAETLTRLCKAGYLLRRKTALGVWAYLLTNSGATRANEGLAFEVSRNGYDLSQLDVGKQAAIVAYLLAQKGALRLGPAGVRGAVRSGMVENKALLHADALTFEAHPGNWRPAMVARSLHPELVRKARRLRAAAGSLELLGHPALLRQFRKAMDADQEWLGGSWE